VLAIAALVLVAVLAYAPSWLVLHGMWTDVDTRTYAHGYLIAAISAALIYRDRDRLWEAPARPAPWALAAVLGLSLAWLVAWRGCLQDVHLVLWPLIVLSAVLAAFGAAVARLLAFPLGFLYFALPVWGELNDALLTIATRSVNALVWLTGLPAYVEGNLVHVPSGTLELALGCSGLHFLIMGLAVAALYGEWRHERLARRLWLLALMGVLAIITNTLRIFTVVVVAYATHMRGYLVAVDHYWFGWLVFAGAVVVFLWISERMPPLAPRPVESARGSASADHATLALPGWLAAAGGLILVPVVGYALQTGTDHSGRVVRMTWPTAEVSWSGPAPTGETPWMPSFRNASVSGLRSYQGPDGAAVESYGVAYLVQRQDGKLVGYYSSLLGNGGGLRPVARRLAETPAGNWREEEVADRNGARSLIWSRYQIGGHELVGPLRAQIAYGALAALGNAPVSSLVALRATCGSSCDEARRRLRAAAGSGLLSRFVVSEAADP
jgi:exosortase